ncbi:hypothetical protein EV209_2851 [Cuneatibacter caecimuris]|uniref:Uncharacterized protein n=2 Tax=Cuneatibacter caecimuris TaxID=1796618 RepID=A0A4Q7P0C0_9FIRM|nr:hypothetical protein EV209_2851 [Cuneatibacter caecimuris]
MRIKIRTKGIWLFVPLPAGLVSFAVRRMPDRMFEEMYEKTPEPYNCLLTRDFISMVLDECMEFIRENKGLEIIHVEAADGTFVSVKL